jgi:hypothetical protein
MYDFTLKAFTKRKYLLYIFNFTQYKYVQPKKEGYMKIVLYKNNDVYRITIIINIIHTCIIF